MRSLAEARRDLAAAVAVVRHRLGATRVPPTALVLGSGLGGIVAEMKVAGAVAYRDIPHHPVSTVPGHCGQLLWGEWHGVPLLVQQGRFHLYEGYDAAEIAFSIRLLAALGIRRLWLTNAAGGLHPDWRAGDLMLVRDHLNFTGRNPLVGAHAPEWGARFPALDEPYSAALRDLARAVAADAGLALREGVYAGVLGPSLETAAETRWLRQAGADAVGMSTVLETIAAVQAGLEVFACSVISNINDPDQYAKATHEEILAAGEAAGPRLANLLAGMLRRS